MASKVDGPSGRLVYQCCWIQEARIKVSWIRGDPPVPDFVQLKQGDVSVSYELLVDD
jgi:hypothetical protein